MLIFKEVASLQSYLNTERTKGKSIGFIPTMGALHDGHLSLIRAADAEIKLCSIYVNPAQFNDASDLEKYPRTVEADIELLSATDCDALFLPADSEIYPEGNTSSDAEYDLGHLDTVLEAESRPGHFQGVAKVLDRFFQIIHPDHLYMGQKDYQQCKVVQRLIDIKGYKIAMHILPIAREADGLAMSSRNRRLTEPQRALAGLLYQCLVSVQAKKALTGFPVVARECREILEQKGFIVDYILLCDAGSLEVLSEYDANRPMVCLIAARLGDIRLIDNMEL